MDDPDDYFVSIPELSAGDRADPAVRTDQVVSADAVTDVPGEPPARRRRTVPNTASWAALSASGGVATLMFTGWTYAYDLLDLLVPSWKGPWVAAMGSAAAAVLLGLWALVDAPRREQVGRLGAWVLVAALTLTVVGLPVAVTIAASLLRRDGNEDFTFDVAVLRGMARTMTVSLFAVLLLLMILFFRFLDEFLCPWMWPCD